jgi:hypothetical protein
MPKAVATGSKVAPPQSSRHQAIKFNFQTQHIMADVSVIFTFIIAAGIVRLSRLV